METTCSTPGEDWKGMEGRSEGLLPSCPEGAGTVMNIVRDPFSSGLCWFQFNNAARLHRLCTPIMTIII